MDWHPANSALMLSSIVLAIGISLYVYVRSSMSWRARSHGRPLPPGPPSLPVVGSLFQIPQSNPWIGYRDLCANYGDIMHFKALGQHVVVLGTSEVIFEYLDKRSANTSDRLQSPLIEIIGAEINMVFMPYGQWWRRHRRAFWQYFHPAIAMEYRPIQRAMTHRFLYKLLIDPSQFKDHIRYTFAAAMMKILYSNDNEDDIERQMAWVELYQEGISQGLVPGKYLVETFPFLRRLPSYFLGQELRLKAVQWRDIATTLKEVPFTRIKNYMLRDETKVNDSILGKLVARIPQDATVEAVHEGEDVAKNTAVVSFEGGADTMFSSIQTTFLAMSLYPDVLRKAQAELDTVVGPNRLPDWDDEESLPYVKAIVKESLRWQNVLPLSIPHCTTADDELHGYFIPAGTVLLPNSWACMHDPAVYEDPEEYRPERFLKDGKLDPSIRDPSAYAFGYGRRICPGRHFAQAALFINTASLLHVFDITPPLDDDGHEIKVQPQMSDGLVVYPEDCRCTITPRSAQAEALITSAREEAYAGNERSAE